MGRELRPAKASCLSFTCTEGPRASSSLGHQSPAQPSPRARIPAPALARTHISVMVSGRLAGMAVRPLPRQSTMPLLQVHMAGQEPEERVQEGTRPASPWPEEAVGCDLGVSRASTSHPRYGIAGGDRAYRVSLKAGRRSRDHRGPPCNCGRLAHSTCLLDVC